MYAEGLRKARELLDDGNVDLQYILRCEFLLPIKEGGLEKIIPAVAIGNEIFRIYKIEPGDIDFPLLWRGYSEIYDRHKLNGVYSRAWSLVNKGIKDYYLKI